MDFVSGYADFLQEKAGIALTELRSLASVDPVLNCKWRVRESSSKLMQHAAEKLGHVRDVSAANLAKCEQYRFACVIPAAATEFAGTLREALKEAACSRKPS